MKTLNVQKIKSFLINSGWTYNGIGGTSNELFSKHMSEYEDSIVLNTPVVVHTRKEHGACKYYWGKWFSSTNYLNDDDVLEYQAPPAVEEYNTLQFIKYVKYAKDVQQLLTEIDRIDPYDCG